MQIQHIIKDAAPEKLEKVNRCQVSIECKTIYKKYVAIEQGLTSFLSRTG